MASCNIHIGIKIIKTDKVLVNCAICEDEIYSNCSELVCICEGVVESLKDPIYYCQSCKDLMDGRI